jgi:hypothetical protein
MKTICLDNFFDIHELFWLYNSLLNTQGWKINAVPEVNSNNPNKLYGNIGNLNLDHTSNWFTYFQGVIFRINKELAFKKNTKIFSNIERVYINATNPMSKHWLHQDSRPTEKKMSILTMFTPQWQDSWQGSFFVDGEEYKMKPGRIIIFDSDEFHTGSNPSEDCPYVRLTCNIVVGK